MQDKSVRISYSFLSTEGNNSTAIPTGQKSASWPSFAHTVIAFQVAVDRLDASPFAKKIVCLFLLVVSRIFLRIQLFLEGAEKARLCGGFRRSIYGKHCKIFNLILKILAIISQGKNQFFPIVLRVGRDFKGRLIADIWWWPV